MSGKGYQLVRLRHDLVESNPIILASFPGSADNVASWMTFGRCPGRYMRDIYPAVTQPESLCFVYDNGTIMKAKIAGEMCQNCYDALVPDGWNTYSAPYSAGRIDSKGSWSPMIIEVGKWDNGQLILTSEEGMDTQEFTESIYGLDVDRIDKSSGLSRNQIAFPSYEFAAVWREMVKARKPFYCDMVNLLHRYDPKAPAEQENLRIRTANDPYYYGTSRNVGFRAGENTQHEIQQVGSRHEEMSRAGIYVRKWPFALGVFC